MSRMYMKGYNFERRVRKWFEEHGYFVARQCRSAFPDLIVIGTEDVKFVECKVNLKNLTKRERYRLIELAAKYNATPMVAHREGRKIKFKIVTEKKLIDVPIDNLFIPL